MPTFVVALVLLILYALGSWVPGLAGDRLGAELARQFGPFEALETRVESVPPIRAMTGKIDRLAVRARGFLVQGVPVASLSLDTGAFELSPWSVLQGHPRLERPLEATAGVVITEDGLNQLLRSPQITRQLRGIPLQVSFLPGMPALERRVDVFPGRLRVHPGGLSLVGTLDFGGGALVPFAASASPRLVGPNLVAFEGVEASMMGSALPPGLLGKGLKPVDLATLMRLEGSASMQLVGLELVPGQVRAGARLMLPQL